MEKNGSDENDDGKRGLEGQDEKQDGTGLGEGRGENDVSNEIEDSAQFDELNHGADDDAFGESPPRDHDGGKEFDDSRDDGLKPISIDKETANEEDDETSEDLNQDREMGDVSEDDVLDQDLWEGYDENLEVHFS